MTVGSRIAPDLLTSSLSARGHGLSLTAGGEFNPALRIFSWYQIVAQGQVGLFWRQKSLQWQFRLGLGRTSEFLNTRNNDTSDKPQDAEARRKVKPVICYPNETLPVPDLDTYRAARQGARKVDEILLPARNNQ